MAWEISKLMNYIKIINNDCLLVMNKGNSYVNYGQVDSVSRILNATKYDIYNNKHFMKYIENKELVDRIFVGSMLNKLEYQQSKLKWNPLYDEIEEGLCYTARLKVDKTMYNTLELNQTMWGGIKNHDVILRKVNNKLYYYKCTSKPTTYEMYINLYKPNLHNHFVDQFVSKYPHPVNNFYTLNIDIVDRVNETHIFREMEVNGCFDNITPYNNTFNAIVADESRLSKVKKNIAIFFKEEMNE